MITKPGKVGLLPVPPVREKIPRKSAKVSMKRADRTEYDGRVKNNDSINVGCIWNFKVERRLHQSHTSLNVTQRVPHCGRFGVPAHTTAQRGADVDKGSLPGAYDDRNDP